METNAEDLKHIRSMMERSSKFLSLSGISGISAGIVALIGAVAAHFVLKDQLALTHSTLYDLIIIASTVLVSAAGLGFYFSERKAVKNGQKLWMSVTFQILKDFGIPTVVGGLFCLILTYKHVYFMVAPSMLIFYGLGLINAGARMFQDIKILGACEIVLGLIAAVVVGYDLLFWGIGFGVLHIIYGVVIYYKYDTKSSKH